MIRLDYKTKSATREDMRALAVLFRTIFEIPATGAFPVLEILDRLPNVTPFEKTTISIVEDNALEINIPAQCTIVSDDEFIIEIKQSVYDGAYLNNTGAYRAHILHELCHVFLYSLGYKPILERSYRENELPAFCSIEWQAKALCGEIMMPYEETKGKTIEELIADYAVSKSAAEKRMRY